MENVTFELPRWKSFFEGQGLTAFDDFFDYQDGDTVNQNTKRNVIVMTLPDGGQRRTFYMKRFFNPHFKDMLFTLRNFGKLCTQAELEWRNAQILLENDIETYHPVCYGTDTAWGIERRSFFITEQINGRCLLDYLIESWEQLDRQARENLVVRLGCFFKKIHAAGLNLPDAYIWHVYMVHTGKGTDDYEFGMIDLHRMQIRTRSKDRAAMNLGRFFFSLPEGFMDERLRKLFMTHYLNGQAGSDPEAFFKRARKWEAKLLKRRKKVVQSLQQAPPSAAQALPD